MNMRDDQSGKFPSRLVIKTTQFNKIRNKDDKIIITDEEIWKYFQLLVSRKQRKKQEIRKKNKWTKCCVCAGLVKFVNLRSKKATILAILNY